MGAFLDKTITPTAVTGCEMIIANSAHWLSTISYPTCTHRIICQGPAKKVHIHHTVTVCTTDITTSWWALSSPTTTPTPRSSSSTPASPNRGYTSWHATWIEPVGGGFSWLRVNSCRRGSFRWCWRFVWCSIIARIFCGTFSSFKIQRDPFLTTTYKSVENININRISILQSCKRLISFNSKF